MKGLVRRGWRGWDGFGSVLPCLVWLGWYGVAWSGWERTGKAGLDRRGSVATGSVRLGVVFSCNNRALRIQFKTNKHQFICV